MSRHEIAVCAACEARTRKSAADSAHDDPARERPAPMRQLCVCARGHAPYSPEMAIEVALVREAHDHRNVHRRQSLAKKLACTLDPDMDLERVRREADVPRELTYQVILADTAGHPKFLKRHRPVVPLHQVAACHAYFPRGRRTRGRFRVLGKSGSMVPSPSWLAPAVAARFGDDFPVSQRWTVASAWRWLRPWASSTRGLEKKASTKRWKPFSRAASGIRGRAR